MRSNLEDMALTELCTRNLDSSSRSLKWFGILYRPGHRYILQGTLSEDMCLEEKSRNAKS
jgi:hypothetical protein